MEIATMNKGQLRQAMRDLGLSYKGLDNEGMRAALLAHAAPVVQEVETTEAELDLVAAPVAQEEVEFARDPQNEAVFDAALQGVVDAVAAHVAVGELDAAPTVQIPEVAPVVQIPTPLLAPRATSKGLKIEKDRPMQNGVRQPSAGGLCRAVWDYCQGEHDAGMFPSAKSVKAHAVQIGWNTNNASIEFYNWRKFNGISGRRVA
jgi:hypothetical protein